MTKNEQVTVEWCGPVGHVSKTFGELKPGQTYTVSAELAGALLDSVLWKRPAAKAKEKE